MGHTKRLYLLKAFFISPFTESESVKLLGADHLHTICHHVSFPEGYFIPGAKAKWYGLFPDLHFLRRMMFLFYRLCLTINVVPAITDSPPNFFPPVL